MERKNLLIWYRPRTCWRTIIGKWILIEIILHPVSKENGCHGVKDNGEPYPKITLSYLPQCRAFHQHQSKDSSRDSHIGIIGCGTNGITIQRRKGTKYFSWQLVYLAVRSPWNGAYKQRRWSFASTYRSDVQVACPAYRIASTDNYYLMFNVHIIKANIPSLLDTKCPIGLFVTPQNSRDADILW